MNMLPQITNSFHYFDLLMWPYGNDKSEGAQFKVCMQQEKRCTRSFENVWAYLSRIGNNYRKEKNTMMMRQSAERCTSLPAAEEPQDLGRLRSSKL